MFWLFGTYHSIQLAGVTAVKPLHVQGKIIYKLMTVPVLSLPGHLLLPAWADRSSPDLCTLPQSEFALNPILTLHCPTPWKETLDVSAASQWITLLCPAPHCRDPSVALHSERLWGWPSDATIRYQVTIGNCIALLQTLNHFMCKEGTGQSMNIWSKRS